MKRHRSLSDEEILDLFRQGIYRIEGAFIVSARYGKRVAINECGKRQPDNPYYSVRIWHKGRRKNILIHKLFWMVYHNRTVPLGHQLHHRKTKKDWMPQDIELLTPERHEEMHQEALDDFLSH